METNEKVINNPYGFIYITTNMVNGKKYLGQKKFNKGWETYLGSGTYFNRAVDKYSEDNFDRNIVCFCYSPEELNQVEYDLSVFLDVVESPDWYNLCYGGATNAGYQHSEEDKIKMRAASKIRWSNEEERKKYSEMHKKENLPVEVWERMLEGLKNRGENDEWKAKLSTIAKERFANPENNPMFGRNHTEETKKKQSQLKQGMYVGEKNHFYGKTHTEETKEKLRIANKGNWAGEKNPFYGSHRTRGAGPRARKIVRLLDEKVYECIMDAAEDNHMDRHTVTRYCKTHKDFMYYDEWLTAQND